MNEEIKEDNNCIIKAFENNPIAIITEEIDNKKNLLFYTLEYLKRRFSLVRN